MLLVAPGVQKSLEQKLQNYQLPIKIAKIISNNTNIARPKQALMSIVFSKANRSF